MYSVGEVVYAKCGFTGKVTFYMVSGKFINYFGDLVYELQSVTDDKYGPVKITEVSKHMGWLHKTDDLTLF